MYRAGRAIRGVNDPKEMDELRTTSAIRPHGLVSPVH